MKFADLDKLVARDIKHNNVPMLVGEPGIGKSSWVEGLANTLGTRCFCLAINQLADKADLTGCRLVPTGKKNKKGEDDYCQVFYPHTIIRQAIDYAEGHPDETPILFLDEINRTTPDVTSEALSFAAAFLSASLVRMFSGIISALVITSCIDEETKAKNICWSEILTSSFAG